MKDNTAVFLSPQDLADRYGVPLESVYSWNKAGEPKCPKHLKIGRHVRYRLSDVISWERTRVAERGRVA